MYMCTYSKVGVQCFLWSYKKIINQNPSVMAFIFVFLSAKCLGQQVLLTGAKDCGLCLTGLDHVIGHL